MARCFSPDAIIAAPIVDGTSMRSLLLRLKHTTLPNLKIIFFASRIDPNELASVDEVDISAYLITADLSNDGLRHALGSVLIGDLIVASREVVQAFFRVNGPRSSAALQAPTLTDREAAVLRLLADGQSRQEIATIVGNSLHSVERTIARTQVKLDAPNMFLLAKRATELGFFS